MKQKSTAKVKLIMLNVEEYKKLHPKVLQPTDMLIPPEQFRETMQRYDLAFRSWGRKKQHMPRYAIPLVNENGSLHNNPDICGMPLDEWNWQYDGTLNEDWKDDKSFHTPTKVLSEPCFNAMDPIKKFMLRSLVLRWDAKTLFYPHTDVWFPAPIVRIWGTDDPTVTRIQFDRLFRRVEGDEDPDFHPPKAWAKMPHEVEDYPPEEIEPGRLYVMDTNIIHAARTVEDRVGYQFFIALHTDCIEELWKHVL